MLDLDRHHPKTRNKSFSQWLYQALQKPEQGPLNMRLRVRLKGNNLLVLCEAKYCPQASKLVPRLGKLLKSSQGQHNIKALGHKDPIYQVVVYGKEVGQNCFAWIKTIALNTEESAGLRGEKRHLDSHKNLARSGHPEAIARYLSAVLSHLGISVRVVLQKLSSLDKNENKKPFQGEIPDYRLWVICSCNYSPDLSLIAAPVAQKLRALELEGYKEAIVRAQVRGEEDPDWTLRIDLTQGKQILKNWARWGDVQALTYLLNQELENQRIEVRAVLKDVTLHLFASTLSHISKAPEGIPNQEQVIASIAPILELIKPQGIESATVYGIQNPQFKKNKNEPSVVNVANVNHPVNAHSSEVPVWIKWLNLMEPGEGVSTYSLAQQGDKKALTFLLQRLLNPDLEECLRLGGMRVRLCRKQNLLHVMCEGITCPSQDIVQQIESLLRQLSIPQLVGVRIYGRRSGNSSASWGRGVDFVSRKSLAVETTPEFIATENYAQKVETATNNEALISQPEEEADTTILEKIREETKQLLQQTLCLSRLFLPEQQPTLAPSLSKKGIRATIAWATLGLILMLTTDRLLGFWLQSSTQTQQQEQPLLADFEEELLSPSPNSTGFSEEQNGVFNQEQFTQKGAQGLSRPRASTAAILAYARSDNPSFNNRLLDEKLALYQQKIKEEGKPPDVLIVGSSRALRGVDPQRLKETLAEQGYEDLEVFNFGVNGATAKVVDFILRNLLSPEQLPKLIIWADGARAFNGGREDLTYQAIANSAGYQKLNAGNFTKSTQENTSTRANLTSSYEIANDWVNELLGKLSGVYPQRDRLKALFRDQFANLVHSEYSNDDTNEEGTMAIDIDGFLPLSERFDPQTYYQKHPLVSGNYDGDYKDFRLDGEQDQALENLLQFLATQNSSLVFVNLPLTNQYLDEIRRKHEQEFIQYMARNEMETNLIFLDFANILSGQNQLFSDPSHLNRYGAYKVSQSLGQEDEISFNQVKN